MVRWLNSLALFLITFLAANPAQGRVDVYVAVSLADVVEEIGAQFTEKTGTEIRIVRAGSSILARQIAGGAPADVFLSAHVDWNNFVQVTGNFFDWQPLQFGNGMVVVGRSDFDGEIGELSDLVKLIGDRRLAVGDPDHVPAGFYAKEALQNAGVWEAVADQLAPAADVRNALRLVQTGATPLGIVYASDVIASDLQVIGIIDPLLHSAIVFGASMARNADEEAQGFYQYLQSEDALNVALDAGFVRLQGSFTKTNGAE